MNVAVILPIHASTYVQIQRGVIDVLVIRDTGYDRMTLMHVEVNCSVNKTMSVMLLKVMSVQTNMH